ncbi:MAG: hypothetical protein HRU36_00110 [Rickettsiales bacterium]|nr:hypothetical protein [Rickettsiales bacterium]
MTILVNSLALVLLFWLLGVAANITVKNVKRLASILQIKFFAMGILLALITTLPEFAVGVHAIFNNVAPIAVGNLLGGIPVLFGVILGFGLVLNKKITTDGRLRNVVPEAIVIFSPIILGLTGKYGFWDGVIMIGLYLGVVYYVSCGHLSTESIKTIREEIQMYSTIRVLSLSLVGLILIVLLSSWILMITISLLTQLKINQLLLGIIVFSIGTNLPEITIIIASWYKKIPELSLNSLIGSALANVLMLGILALIKPIEFPIDYSFFLLAIFLAIILILFVIFYHSNREMNIREGLILFGVYILFLVANFIIIKMQIR